ncbi:MAG: metallophosphoesterase [Clostridia bacterium]|nr:metallophosphoesterase [Clostridia bacterium]
MKFVMMTDTHYISRRMICGDDYRDALNDIAVTEQALRQAAKEDCDTIIITGDLTDDGDIYSHEDFVELLKEIKATGKRICVFFATHDFHHHRAYVRKKGDSPVQFKSLPWEMPYFDEKTCNFHDYVKDEFSDLSEEECRPQLVRAASPEEIWKMYYDFGPAQAYSVHESDFSYCVDLDENNRCLMLNDIFRNEEALEDISASFTPDCLRWIERMISEAKRDGKYIFACSHHPFIPAVPAHRLMAGLRNLRSPYTVHMLADMGIDLVFSGHTHLADVDFARSAKGNLIFNVATPSVRFFPPVYRMIDLDGEKGVINYSCVEVRKTPEIITEENTLYNYYRNRMYNEYYNSICGKDNFIGKLLRKLKIKNVRFLFRNAKLTKEEYSSVKDMKFFDFVMGLALDMLEGASNNPPGSAGWKLGMGLAAFADSLINSFPFVDLKKKLLQGYSVTEIIEPLLYNSGYSNIGGTVKYREEPAAAPETGRPHSCAGPVIMAVLCILAIILSPLMPLIFTALIILKAAGKHKKNRQADIGPEMKYYI